MDKFKKGDFVKLKGVILNNHSEGYVESVNINHCEVYVAGDLYHIPIEFLELQDESTKNSLSDESLQELWDRAMQEEIDEQLRREFEKLIKTCDCGAKHTKNPNLHSDWCTLKEK